MVRIFREEDAKLDIILDKTIAIIGYGVQGRAWALNMRDSGLNIIVGVRPGGKSWELAKSEGFSTKSISEAVSNADVTIMLIPDMVQPSVWVNDVQPSLKNNTTVCFAHGFNIRFELIKPLKSTDIVMVAPKGPGKAVRDEYLRGRGVPALIAIHQDYTGKALETALAIAKANGFTKAGVMLSTFAEETETDLIGEQSLLVGGLAELIRKTFEVLVELGYQPEVAYFETLYETKLIMDLIWEYGIYGMLEGVSETARYGGLTVGSYVIDETVKERIRKAAERVRNGEFAKEWIEEYSKNSPKLKKLMENTKEHTIEKVGKLMREIILKK